MEAGECQPIDLDFKPYDLRGDDQFSENQMDFNGDDLLGSMSGIKKFDGSSEVDMDDQVPELQSSKEPERAQRTGRYNLRQSLAWDSAFFTSAGVLDQQELTSMISGANKGEHILLSGIEEDISGSTDSISTLESGNLNLESADEDLFLDIRASIQRSSKKPSNFEASNSKAKGVGIDSSAMSSLKKEEPVMEKKNPKPGVKKTSSLQHSKTPKCLPKPNTGKAGPVKSMKQDSTNLQMAQMKSNAKVTEISSRSGKPPKVISRPIPALPPTTKRDSVGTTRVKSETTVSSKGDQPPKAPIASGARRIVSSKISSVSSTTSRLTSVRSSTSSSSSGTMFSVTSAKPSQIMPRRNPAKTGVVRSGLSSPKPDSSRAALKNKPAHSTLSAHLMSSKISSNVSPASSISEWSSASSSSAMFSPRSNNYRTSVETSSCRSVDSSITVLDQQISSADETVDIQNTLGVALPGTNVEVSLAQSDKIQPPAKPSGLRRPSPKIGFFDGVKSARTNVPLVINATSHSVMPKAGSALCSPAHNSSRKLKSNKVPRATVGASAESMKLKSSKDTSSSPLQEKIDALANKGSAIMGLKEISGVSLEVTNNAVPESFVEAEKVLVESGAKEVVDACKATVVNENTCITNNKTEFDIQKSTSNEDEKYASVEVCNSLCLENVNQRQDLLLSENNKQNRTHSVSEAHDKENDLVQYQSEGLTTHSRNLDPVLYESKFESLSDDSSTDYVLLNPATASESGSGRIPFAVKNVIIDNGCTDLSDELVHRL